MFVGHFALAFAAKRVEPRTSLGTYFVAAQLPDLIWPFLVLAGYERVAIAAGDTAFTPLRFEYYPISHSLLTVAGWATLVAALHWLGQRRPRAALLLWALVVSHWVLDFISHRPDMPLLPGGGVVVGLGLWNSVPGTLVVEGLMFAAGVWLYVTTTRPKDAVGRYGFLGLVGALVLFYLGAAFGPPAPSAQAVAMTGVLGFVLLVLGAGWADRHRAVIPPA